MALTQANRPIAISTPLGEDVLVLTRMTGHEALGHLFEYQLDLLSENHKIKLDDVLGGNMTVRLDVSDDMTRYFNGYASHFLYLGSQGRYAVYKVTLHPWLWFLTRTADCRILINIYFVPQIGSAAEINSVHGSATSARRNAATFGSLISDQAATAGHVIAHELGHVLNLINDPRGSFIHADGVRQGGPAGTGRRVRHDISTRRRLMFSTVGFPANGGMAYRDNVGYGANINGDLLAVKQLNADRTDQEAQEVRNTAGRI